MVNIRTASQSVEEDLRIVAPSPLPAVTSGPEEPPHAEAPAPVTPIEGQTCETIWRGERWVATLTGLRVPRYSHETYDVERDAWDVLTPSDVVLLEGVNAIGAIRDLVDLGIYLEAAEADLERWYVTRFLELVQEGRHDASSFYASMAALSDDDVERLARSTWVGINLINLRDHIAPTRALADIVVVKGPDHSIVEVREHDREGRRG